MGEGYISTATGGSGDSTTGSGESTDGGGSSANEHKLFVVANAPVSGTVANFDSLCQSVAPTHAAINGETWKAVVSPKTRVSINGPVKNLKGEVVANNESEFWGSWQTGVYANVNSLNQFSTLTVWAGMSLAGEAAIDCGGWTSTAGMAALWTLDQVSNYRMASAMFCAENKALLCINQ